MFERADNFIASYRRAAQDSMLHLPSVLLVTGSLLLSLTAIIGTSQPSQALIKKRILSQPLPSPETLVETPVETPARPVVQSPTIPDGIYLYGQSPEPEQIGAGYMVFESRQDRVVGAFYQPQSYFDCFYGSRESQNLSLSVVNSYENTTYAYALGMSDFTIASSGNTGVNFGLQGLHRIDEVSDNDTRILDTCKENYQDRAWY